MGLFLMSLQILSAIWKLRAKVSPSVGARGWRQGSEGGRQAAFHLVLPEPRGCPSAGAKGPAGAGHPGARRGR